MVAHFKGKDGFPEVTVSYGVKVLGVPHLSGRMLQSIQTGRYEKPEIEASLQIFEKGDRIVEMGTGLGLVGAIVAKNTKPSAVLSFEGNHELFPGIDALYRYNRLGSKIELKHAILMSNPDAPDSIRFHRKGNFLGSNVLPDDSDPDGYRVPVLHWSDVKSEFKPNALLMDIEGAELDFFRHADLDGIDKIVFETHRGVYQRPGVLEIKSALIGQGFQQCYHSKGVKAFVRAD